MSNVYTWSYSTRRGATRFEMRYFQNATSKGNHTWNVLSPPPSKHGQDPWRLDWGQTKTSQIWPKISPDLNQDAENGRPSDLLVTSYWWRPGNDVMIIPYGLWSGLVLNVGVVTGWSHYNVIMTSFGLLGEYAIKRKWSLLPTPTSFLQTLTFILILIQII